ncbi:MAG: sigma-54-dependent transcriptional regulator [Methylophilus sp.]|uniref:sigma-54-dependent transcriptional regulator n=1 Tax=Methylophilus sp. TaxID=29541 RepID=UPI003F9FE416
MQNISEFNKEKPIVLIVEDEVDLADVALKRVERAGYEVQIAETITYGIELTSRFNPDIIVLDVNLPDGSSLKSIDSFLNKGDKLPPSIILTTSESNAKVTELFEMIKQGKIKSYLQKPYKMDDLVNQVHKEAEARKLAPAPEIKREVAKVIDQQMDLDKPNFIGNSPSMTKVKNHIASLAEVFQKAQEKGGDTATPVVYIAGETGAGKSELAKYFKSLLPGKKYMPLDSTQLTSELIAVELFGATKGSYTGADSKKDRVGLLEDIGDGILFLDEIGELSLDLQARLLVPIQQRSFRPIGSNVTKPFKGIILCATNKDLEKMVEEGTFRADLYHRIKTHEFHIPSLRDRAEDIPLIAQDFLTKFTPVYDLPDLSFADSGIKFITQYKWPGNIRELQNALHKVMMLYVINEVDITQPHITSDMLSSVMRVNHIDAQIKEAALEKSALETPEIPDQQIAFKPNKVQTKRYNRLMKAMQASPHLTLRQIAKKLSIPYSTAHHTIDQFEKLNKKAPE